MTPAEQMRAVSDLLRDEANLFDRGKVQNGSVLDLACKVLSELSATLKEQP